MRSQNCGWLAIYLSVYLIQISIKTVVDVLTTEKFYFAFPLYACVISPGVCKVTVFLFLTGTALYKTNIFPEVWGFFFFIFQKFSLRLYPRKRRNKEKYNIQNLHSSSKPDYYKVNESDLLFSLNFHVAVVDFTQFTASLHRAQCSTWA